MSSTIKSFTSYSMSVARSPMCVLIVLTLLFAIASCELSESVLRIATAHLDHQPTQPSRRRAQSAGNMPPAELSALYDLYNSTNGKDWQWTPSLGYPWTFTPNANPCTENWQGITCQNSSEPHVLTVELDAMNLIGTLPVTLAELTHMEVFSAYDNSLSGTIPESIYTLTNLADLIFDFNHLNGTLSNNVALLTHLVALSLYSNDMTGTIPNALGNLTELYFISLNDNNFYGTIPATLGSLPNLMYLYLSNNMLTGTVPDHYVSTNMYFIEYSYNMLHGTIPTSYGNLTNLHDLKLSSNHFTGTVPETYYTLTNLTYLIFGDNLLTGTLPAFMGNFPNMFYLDYSHNYLNGTIPNSIGNLTQLNTLYGYDNLITGTIPNSLGQCTLLSYLILNNNRLVGTIPASIGGLSGLIYLELNNNYLSGSIPDTFNYPDMYLFDLSTNKLTGSIPEILGDMVNTVYLYLHINMLSGTLPSVLFTNLPELYVIDINTNYITGPIPVPSHTFSPILQYVNAFHNYLTGTLPSSYGQLNLQFLMLSDNYLTGTIHSNYGDMVYLENLYLDTNLLHGTIPSSIADIPYLQFLGLEVNMLTGSVPTTFSTMAYIINLLLYQNHLTGNIEGVFNASVQYELTTVVFNNNQFTGNIPEELFRLPKLNSFSGVSNCFQGMFPANMCNATTVSSLALDGLSSASTCRNTLFPRLSSSYVVTSSVGTTIPECLFHLPILTTLHLSGNGLTGALPDTHIAPLLIDLALSHNILTGTIPLVYQRRQWYNLDLSYNRLSGDLSPHFESQVLNSSFYTHLSDVIGLNITHNTSETSLSLENNRLSGRLPHSIQNKQNVSVLGSNVFSCNLQESNLPVHDSGRANYQCGSDSFNVPFYIWLVSMFILLVLVVVVYRYRSTIDSCLGISYAISIIEKWQSALVVHALVLDPANRLLAYQGVIELSVCICKIAARCTLYMFVVLLPLYTVASVYSGTFWYQYAWTVSAAYLTGVTVAVLQIVFLVGLLCVMLYGYTRYISTHQRDIATVASGGKERRTLPTLPTIFIYTCFILLNLTAVVGANVAFVYVAIYGKNDVLLIAQLLLSCFKLFWNRFFSVYLIRWAARAKAMIQQRQNSDESQQSESSGRSILTPHDRNQFVTLQMFVSLLNNIGIPCLVVAGVSPNCFYNLFVGAPVIDTHYTFESCTLVQGSSCAIVSAGELAMTYTPPFTYNYQCSSSFITYYAPTFVFVCIMRAFLSPLLQFVLYYLHRDATPGTQWHSLLDSVLLPSLRPINTAADVRVDVYKPYFDANQMLLSLFTYTGILLTFGAVFPPVALALLVTLLSVLYFNQLKVGRILCIAAEKGILEYIDVIETESRRAGFLPVLHRVVWMLITVCCWFYTLFIFDTLGDSVGFEGAYWVLIVMPSMPLCIFAVYTLIRALHRMRAAHLQADKEGDNSAPDNRGSTATTHNVLHAQNTTNTEYGVEMSRPSDVTKV